MNKSKRDYFMYLEDIILAMSRIAEYVDGYDFARFEQDYKTVDAVIRNFEIIGEAAKNVSDELKLKYQEIPWQEMYSLRNKVSHEYHGIDHSIIWDIATRYLPDNKRQMEKLLSELR